MTRPNSLLSHIPLRILKIPNLACTNSFAHVIHFADFNPSFLQTHLRRLQPIFLTDSSSQTPTHLSCRLFFADFTHLSCRLLFADCHPASLQFIPQEFFYCVKLFQTELYNNQDLDIDIIFH